MSDEKYLTSIQIWNKFNLKSMSEYHDHYLKTKDVVLLAGVFEKFINKCLKFYKLDPCQYVNLPGLSWDVMLEITRIKLKQISGNEKLLKKD